MKATKLIAIIAFAGFGLCTQGVFAQGNDQTEQAPPPIVDETTPPAATETPVEGTETEPYNEKVTIDDSNANGGGTIDNGISAQPEKKERLRVYSGKHDGNNVVSDPR